jgi:subtilisin family serine protease
MNPLRLVTLDQVMRLSVGRPDVKIGLIDGPVAREHPDLHRENIRYVGGEERSACQRPESVACAHGTFVAGLLCARRDVAVPGICHSCTLLVRPIFTEALGGTPVPSATVTELAAALVECVDAGARVVNLSLAPPGPSTCGHHELEDALDYAALRNVIVVAAAGNQGSVGSSPITRHPCVIPVVAYDRQGRPMGLSNLGRTIGARGLGGPGDQVPGLAPTGGPVVSGGTSIAAPFITGAIALLWSEFPSAFGFEIRLALRNTRAGCARLVPPLLDAWSAYQQLVT